MAETRPGSKRPRRTGGDGDPEVFCADEQTDVEIDLARWQTLALDVLEAEGVRGAAELTVVFVDEGTMKQLNTQYMGSSYATDVLSFPLDAVEATRTPGPGALTKGPDKNEFDIADLPLLLGDVVICPAVAIKQAPSHAGSHDDEIALLLVHGILHVLGSDHDNPDAATVMHALERKHLEAFHWHQAAPANFRHVPEVTQ
ncbi:MAG: rRNA maturation RNase YbeY [Actinobacteria bacterium]|nr:MAG: rRNA maturation RNase YbeY [Actinomycetota bacterium]